jgi:hypothetical protein
MGGVPFLVPLEVAVRLRGTGQAEVDRRAQQLQDELARVPHAFGVGLDLHARLDLARARRREHAGARHLDHAHAADVDRGEVLEVAERRRVDP